MLEKTSKLKSHYYCNTRIKDQPKNVKGQLISKYPFGVFKSPKNNNEIFSRISALASKKEVNKDKSTLFFIIKHSFN